MGRRIIITEGSDGVKTIIQSDGVDFPERAKLNFIGPIVSDNPTNNSTDITVLSGRDSAGILIGTIYDVTATAGLLIGSEYSL